jgi:hypothetical protein
MHIINYIFLINFHVQVVPATKFTIDDDDLFGDAFDNLANRELMLVNDTSNLLTPNQILDSVISLSPSHPR